MKLTLFLTIFTICSFVIATNAASSGEIAALNALYTATGGPAWTQSTNWTVGDPCTNSWFGVTCTGGNVTAVKLGSNNMVGTLPEEFFSSALHALNQIKFDGNALTGSLSGSIANFALLKQLNLADNSFTNFPPAALGTIGLNYVYIQDNQFSGVVPDWACSIFHVNVTNNWWWCPIPTCCNSGDRECMGNCRVIQPVLDLYSATGGGSWVNNTNWNVDDPCQNDWFGVGCTDDTGDISSLILTQNNMVGSLPDSFGTLVELDTIDFPNNLLNGNFPYLNKLTNLHYLNLAFNQFTGSIDSDLFNVLRFAMHSCYLSGNQISGTIPAISTMEHIQNFYLDTNSFTGSVPDLTGLFHLQYLDVSHNGLTGTIPASISALSGAFTISLGYNQLTGSIPAGFNNLAKVNVLDVSNNQLTGTLGHWTGKKSHMSTLYLNNNQMTGALDPEICSITNVDASSNYWDCNNLPACCDDSKHTCSPCLVATTTTAAPPATTAAMV